MCPAFPPFYGHSNCQVHCFTSFFIIFLSSPSFLPFFIHLHSILPSLSSSDPPPFFNHSARHSPLPYIFLRDVTFSSRSFLPSLHRSLTFISSFLQSFRSSLLIFALHLPMSFLISVLPSILPSLPHLTLLSPTSNSWRTMHSQPSSPRTSAWWCTAGTRAPSPAPSATSSAARTRTPRPTGFAGSMKQC